MADVKVTKDLDNKKLVIEYVFSAPRERVWQFYADKELFEKWWGPEGWDTTAKEFDFTPGGRIHYDMHCTDERQGEWYDQHSWGLMVIESIDEPSSFTYMDYFTDESGVPNQDMPAIKIVNEFLEEDGKTKLVSTGYADSAEQIEQLIQMGMAEGISSQFSKLDQLLA